MWKVWWQFYRYTYHFIEIVSIFSCFKKRTKCDSVRVLRKTVHTTLHFPPRQGTALYGRSPRLARPGCPNLSESISPRREGCAEGPGGGGTRSWGSKQLGLPWLPSHLDLSWKRRGGRGVHSLLKQSEHGHSERLRRSSPLLPPPPTFSTLASFLYMYFCLIFS